MLTRRGFLSGVGAGITTVAVAGGSLSYAEEPKRKRMAVVTTVWRYGSHAWHMAERFLVGYPCRGGWHRPGLEVVSAYVDQTPSRDLSRQRSQEFGFRIYPSIAEALRCGGDRLAVDAVLVIGEHGDYPDNAIGQKEYPRYPFFKQVVEVFRQDGRATPVFNDKHLSWKWEWAKEMVDTAQALGFPLLAGSSLPVTWRMPSLDMPFGATVEEVLCIAYGGLDSYDFHALETIQCMVERRRGGETGVTAMQALRGEAVWKAQAAGGWSDGGWDPRLFQACLARSQTLQQPETASDRYPSDRQIQDWVKDPVSYRFEYADGVKATMLMLNGLVRDFTFAARIKGQAEPLSTLFYLPPNPNVVYSAALMEKVEEMFLSEKPAYPVQRTLLTSGLLAAAMQSLAAGQKRLETPHLAVRYQVPRISTFWQS
jgi:hypothetical protein